MSAPGRHPVRALSYDARRGILAAKPLLRGWSHLVWFEASLVLGTVLVGTVAADRRTVAVVYTVALSGLFGTSALYHRGTWQPRARRALQRADHAMIFVLIAGSATPVFAVDVPGPAGVSLIAALWLTTAAALVTHLAWMTAPEWLVGSTYIVLGCVGIAALPAVWMRTGPAAFVLLLGGGLLYITGAALYHRRRPDPWPAVFGFHEVFHAFICAAATLHYVAIAVLIL